MRSNLINIAPAVHSSVRLVERQPVFSVNAYAKLFTGTLDVKRGAMKRLVCEVKLERLPAAEQTLKDSFTFMDDTPAYYYSQATLAFARRDEVKAKDWLTRAGGIFKPAERSPYEDCLMEARWLPSLALPPVSGEEKKSKG